MGHSRCCVINCRNNSRNSDCKFYRFPTASWKLQQRKLWIAAVIRQNADGSSWSPKPDDLICSAHFIDGKKSDAEMHSSYIPTKFPTYTTKAYNESENIKRYNRLMQRRQTKEELPFAMSSTPTDSKETDNTMEINTTTCGESSVKDQECQFDTFINAKDNCKTFICNRYIYENRCDAETQTDISYMTKIVIIPGNREFKDKSCGTPEKTFVHQATEANTETFRGFASIRDNQQLAGLAGVTFATFQFLLKRMCSAEKCVISIQDRLFISLMKIKTGLTFSALAVLFGIHRSTISRIFYNTLAHLVATTANLVFWPSKDVVQATMPECFIPDYRNTRVIIDCTEFRIDIPSSVDNRVYCYSHYKKNFTAKVLIGITPGGFICLKSKIAGGRKSDSQMTIESGLLDSLEDGDIVLADKGFPEIKTIIDASGKQVKIVMPPFLEKKKDFSFEETQETYKIARVRIHVERIMQRLRVHQILNKIPKHLFHVIDDIMHICCVLVNLQRPIISTKKENDNADDDNDDDDDDDYNGDNLLPVNE